MNKLFSSMGFFYNPRTQEVLLHKRDGNTPLNPHKWAFFGGGNEEGETPLQTWIREIKEELDVTLRSKEIIPLCDYSTEEMDRWRYVFYIISEKPKSEMTLGEGADFDWIPLREVFDYDLTTGTVRDLKTFLQTI